eukprot:3880121-Rhodomonas_salina.1
MRKYRTVDRKQTKLANSWKKASGASFPPYPLKLCKVLRMFTVKQHLTARNTPHWPHPSSSSPSAPPSPP